MKKLYPLLAVLVLLLCSCQKVEDHWLFGKTWSGYREDTLYTLEFPHEGKDCIFTQAGTDGSFSMNKTRFLVQINEKDYSFILYKESPESPKFTGGLTFKGSIRIICDEYELELY